MSLASKRVNAIGLLREWGRDHVAKGKPISSVYHGLHTAMNNVIQEFLTEHDLEGTRYWLHPESDSYFLTPPGVPIGTDIDAQMCIELLRHEFLSRQGLHFPYLENEL